MPMSVVLAKIRVAPDGTISGQAPRELPPGEYEVPIRLLEANPRRGPLDLPLHDSGWDDAISLRREDIYGPDGR
jgi:hypothetical protein